MSEVVRDHLGRVRVRVRNRRGEKARVAMLNRINANLNMIARWANTHKKAGETVEVITHLAVIERQIAELTQ